jgi:hypothetical protein
MQFQGIIVIVVATLVALFPVFLISYLTCGGLYVVIKRRRKERLLEKAIPDVTCALDIDCPPGFICLEGRCIPQKG